jgi:hypothetical protein
MKLCKLRWKGQKLGLTIEETPKGFNITNNGTVKSLFNLPANNLEQVEQILGAMKKSK